MMNKQQALAYGKRIGVKYLVKSTAGGLYGGYQTLDDAKQALKRFERKDKTNPFTEGKTEFYIEEMEK